MVKNKKGVSVFILILIVIVILVLAIGSYLFFIYNPDCKDNDGGKNYYKSGICYDKTNYVDGGAESCFDRVDGQYISEMSCKNDQCYREPEYKCPKGCGDGACIK